MVGEGWRNQVEEGTWAWRSGYGGEGLLGGYGNGKSGLGSFRMGSSQAVLVFQIDQEGVVKKAREEERNSKNGEQCVQRQAV